MNSLSLLRKPGLLIVAASLASLVLIVASIRASRASGVNVVQQQPGVRVKVLPQKLEVVSFRKTANKLELQFKNGYDRGITAFAVRIAEKEYIEDLIFADTESERIITPNATRTTQYDLPVNSSPLPEILIEAVIFDGHRNEGNQQEVVRILNRRTGVLSMLSRIYPHFTRLGGATDGQLEYYFDQLKEVILIQSTKEPVGMSPYFGSGLVLAKSMLTQWRDELDNKLQFSDRAGLRIKHSQVAARYASLLKSLKDAAFRN